MEIAIADTGFVVALLNQTDARHSDVVPIYTQQSSILLPQTVLAEVAYLVGRDAGIKTVIAFLQGLNASRFCLTALTEADVDRVAEILQTYADSRIYFVDASVMAITELIEVPKFSPLTNEIFACFSPSTVIALKFCRNGATFKQAITRPL